MHRKFWQWRLFGLVWLAVLGMTDPLAARPVPDETLGVERSTVTESTIRGIPSDRIGGGAARGQNLFHSFESFDVEAGRGAYFENPAGVENIFGRVTGAAPSLINGRLGVIQAGSSDVLGNANLFFMNPNGILFGPGASLDVSGSFVGTTANAIGFGEGGFFSATSPEVPSPLLTVNPSAFFFSQATQGTIENQSVDTRPSVGGSFLGLGVPREQSLLLVGGDINLSGTGVYAEDGQVELGGLAEVGRIGLSIDGSSFSLAFPEGIRRSNVSLTNGTLATVLGTGRGTFSIYAQNVTLSEGSAIFTGVLPQFRSGSSGIPGDILIDADGLLILNNGIVLNSIGSDASGRTDGIIIEAGSLSIINGGQVDSTTYGEGSASDITINVQGAISIVGNNSGIFSRVEGNAPGSPAGSGGDVNIQARSFFLRNASIETYTRNEGVGGNINIESDSISLDNARLTSGDTSRSAGDIFLTADGLISLSDVTFDSSIEIGEGDPGDIVIRAGSLIVRDTNFEATTQASESSSTPNGLSNGGTISFVVDGSATFTRSRSDVGVNFGNGSGRAGSISIQASSLSLIDSQLQSSTSTGGSAGSVSLIVDGIALLQASSLQSANRNGEQGGSGLSGDINVRSGSLFLLDGTNIDASTVGGRDGIPLVSGNIFIQVDETLFMADSAILSITTGFANGGQIDLRANSIFLTEVSRVSTGTSDNDSRGDAGDINIQANESILLTDNSFIASIVEPETQGNGGNITVQTQDFTLNRGSVISSSIAGETFDGFRTNPGGQATQGGDISITASRLLISGVSAGEEYSGQFISDFSPNPAGTSSGIYASTGRGATGRGGNIIINAGDLRVFDRGVVNAQTFNDSTGGDITINTSIFEASSGGQVLANTFGRGRAGNITLNATDEVLLSGSDPTYSQRLTQFGQDVVANSDASSGLFTATEPGSAGDSGTIIIRGANSPIRTTLTLADGAEISAATSGTGSAGNILVQDVNSVLLNDSSITTAVNPTAILANPVSDRGNIDIQTQSLALVNEARIIASTLGRGDAGDIFVRGTSTVNLDRSAISSTVNTGAIGQGGNINLSTNSLTLNQGQISSSTSGTGDTGTIAIQANERISLTNNSQIASTVNQGAIGNSQNIVLATPEVTLQQNSQISAATDGTGRAGSITIRGTETNRPAEQVSIDNSTISTEVQQNGVVNAAETQRSNIDIQTRTLNLNNGANITASTANQGNAGNISISNANRVTLSDSNIASIVNAQAIGEGGSITLDTRTLNLDRANLAASTQGQGQAGSITVTDANQVSLDRSTISTAVGETGVGQGGNIAIQADSLNLQNSSDITSSTANRGNTGSIRVSASENIALRSNSSISNRVETGAIGDSQQITLNTPNLSLRGNSEVSAATDGTGQAGDISIQNADRVSLSNSSISTEIQRNAIVPNTGGDRQGNITIDTQSLSLDDRANITASTSGQGRAGNISVPDAQTIRLENGSTLSTAVQPTGQGRGGDITLQTDSLTLDSNAQINAQTRGQGRAGDITVTADTLDVSNGGNLTTSTRSDRRAGTIRVTALERIQLSGTDSGIFASTEAGSTGNGGSIRLSTTDLQVSDRAQVSAQSRGTGAAGGISITASGTATLSDRAQISTRSQGEDAPAGNIRIEADRFTATNSDVTTSAANASGGDIRILGGDIRLFGDSDILTNSGVNGGNITIDADTLIAFDDSDIIAAAGGRGGDIDFGSTIAFFENYNPNNSLIEATGTLQDNGSADINATGDEPGTISLPDTSFVQNSLADLTESAVDADSLIANSCIARTESGGTFLITGSGGLPPRPGTAPLSPYPTGEVRSQAEGQSGGAIVEPQGVYQLPNGQLVMSRECS